MFLFQIRESLTVLWILQLGSTGSELTNYLTTTGLSGFKYCHNIFVTFHKELTEIPLDIPIATLNGTDGATVQTLNRVRLDWPIVNSLVN
jgi:hypothetical protein